MAEMQASPMFKGYFDTIEDMERAYYGSLADVFGKANAPVASGTAGVRNVVFGAMAWSNVCVGANLLGALAKKPWEQSGYRAITAVGSSGSAGQAEYSGTEALPDSLKPTWTPVTVPSKILSAKIEMTAKEVALSGKDDTILWQDYQDYMMKEFKNRINRGLLTDVHTVASTNIESLDRVISSNSEVAGLTLDAGDADIYGLDRDAGASWTDAQVGHASGTDRTLSLALIDAVEASCRPYWDNPASNDNKFILTGIDTAQRIQQLVNTQVRYEPTRVQFGVNGVQTVPGIEAGINVASYHYMPVIQDNFVTQDTISRVYIVDQDHTELEVLTPIDYRESDDYLLLDKYAKVGLFTMQGELWCNLFKANGKVRDLL